MTQNMMYVIIHGAQSFAMKQHDDTCPKGPYQISRHSGVLDKKSMKKNVRECYEN